MPGSGVVMSSSIGSGCDGLGVLVVSAVSVVMVVVAVAVELVVVHSAALVSAPGPDCCDWDDDCCDCCDSDDYCCDS